jgi:hypothetical protein
MEGMENPETVFAVNRVNSPDLNADSMIKDAN